MLIPKAVAVLAGPITILLFATFISSAASTLVAFTTMVISLMFVGISTYLLGWILDKDIGPRSMQEIAETIREGSEGFFKTQYGTIFKFAFGTAIGLFFLYSMRDPVPGSQLNKYFSTMSMAMIMSLSFILGACCSACAGYAGIWVSVRANLRVAAASRNDYNAALQICFRGGAFAAIVNVALAIFGISFLYLVLTLHLYASQLTDA
jgi:Na+/H+-translocating membrane pyrophosphatase